MLLPSEALERLGDSETPEKIIIGIRSHLIKLESSGMHPWCALGQLIGPQMTMEPIESKEFLCQKIKIIRDLARMLIQIDGRQRGLDGLTWKMRIEWCRTTQDYIALFQTLGITEEDWSNSTWLVANGFVALQRKLNERFNGWRNFLIFMGINREESWPKKIASYETPKEFRELFRECGIQNDSWKSMEVLRNIGFPGLYAAIRNRFNGWNNFLIFMGFDMKGSWPKRIATCKSQKDFRKLFKAEGIEGEEWTNSSWLTNRGLQGLYQTIQKRFGSWEKFLTFMGIIVEQSWPKRIAACKEQNDFLKLFHSCGIKSRMWLTGKWLENNGFEGLVLAIRKHFGSWNNFLLFMGEEQKERWHEIINGFHTREDFQNFIRENAITSDNWKNSAWLQKNGFAGFYQSVRDRFGGWEKFVAYMDGRLPFEGFQSERESRECLHKEILRLRESGHWIVQPQKSPEIFPEEWEEIRKHYDDNIVVKAVADYLRNRNN